MIACVVAYDGRKFYGSQRQKTLRSVQQEFEGALGNLYQHDVQTQLASRTDRGVHAYRNVLSFEDPKTIPLSRLEAAIRHRLPDDLELVEIHKMAETFHPRYTKSVKTYEYRIDYQDKLFNRPYAYIVDEELDIDRMMRFSKVFIGEHDFASFSNRQKDVKSTIRKILSIDFNSSKENIYITIKGESFLYNMVRILVQYLIDVGRGMHDEKRTKHLLLEYSRQYTKALAPATGLYLKNIQFLVDEWDDFKV